MQSHKAVVVLSGGQDSTTALYWAFYKKELEVVKAVTFDYGQRHKIEIDAARTQANVLGIEHEIIVLGKGILHSTSPLVSDEKLEQYASHKALPGGLEKTFVPYRNQLFLTIAANRAYEVGADRLIAGVCQEDFGGYPDCRRVFIDILEAASSCGSHTGTDGCPGPLQILTPLMHMTKAESVGLAVRLPGCYGALAYTHTSYDGEYPPTGHDHATLLRHKGFMEAGVPDPLILRAWQDGLMNLPTDYMGLNIDLWLERAGL